MKAHNSDFFDIAENNKFSEFHMAAFAVYSVLSAHAHFDPVNLGFFDYLFNNDD